MINNPIIKLDTVTDRGFKSSVLKQYRLKSSKKLNSNSISLESRVRSILGKILKNQISQINPYQWKV